jgi:hypothetical protein
MNRIRSLADFLDFLHPVLQIVSMEICSTIPWLNIQNGGCMKIYDPHSNGECYIKSMELARKTNAIRDEVDRSAGFAAPGDTPSMSLFLRNAIMAIVVGVETKDWPCVCEGLDMLQQAELKVRTSEGLTKG